MLINRDRARKELAEAGLDGLVATTQENLLYLTGILNVNSFVLPRMVQAFGVASTDRLDTPSVVMGIGDADQYLAAPAGTGRLYTFGTFFREAPTPGALDAREQRMLTVAPEAERHPGPAEALAAAIGDAGLAKGRIAIDEEGIQASVRAKTAELLPKAKLVDASTLLRKIRMVKTAPEIERLRRAQAACENGIKAVAAMAKAGVTEHDMVAAYSTGVIQSGARVTFALIKTGRNAALGQLPASSTRLARGEHVWFDVGAQVDGYHADLARILVLGEPTTKQREYYTAALRGEDHAFAVTRPGMPANHLFDETVQAVRAAGIPHYRRHHVGHGIGAEVYDPPVLNASTSTPIEAGMVINVETPYYELGWGGIHVEDPYVVGADGKNTWLTTMSRDMIIVE
jgi:Xaa-Pro aminopeptidase